MVKILSFKITKAGKSDRTINQEDCKLFYETNKKSMNFKSYKHIIMEI